MKLTWLTAATAVLLASTPTAFAAQLNATQQNAASPISIANPPPGKALWTDTVTYCSNNRSVEVNAFDLTFWRANNSLTFGLSIASEVKNLDFAANVYINAYDIVEKNFTFNMCDYLDGVLCKLNGDFLPKVNFTGYGTVPLPDSLVSRIPEIGWKVPDLDAYARIELVDQSTQTVAACLQTTLTNGWSAESTAAKWATAMFTLVAILLAVWQSMRPRSSSPALFRWFDILSLFQNAAAAGLMNLNTPKVWTAFTRNFAWSLGLFYDHKMQNTIGKFRKATGGKLPFSAYEDMPTINRILTHSATNLTAAFESPQAALAALFQGIESGGLQFNLTADTIKSILGGNLNLGNSTLSIGKRELEKRSIVSAINAESVWANQNGIPQYVNAQGIPIANAYSTIFFSLLIVLAVIVLCHLLVVIPVLVIRPPRWTTHLRRTWWQFCASNFFRFCMAFAFPISIFSFFQFKLGNKDGKLPLVLGALGWVIIFVPLVVILFVCIAKNRRESVKNMHISFLWTDYRIFHTAGTLYRPYKAGEHYFWFNPILIGIITKAGFIAFGPNNQWAQVIGCMAVEVLTLLNIIIFRSYRGRWNNILAFLLFFFRLAVYGILVAFIDSVKTKGIPRTVLGVVQIALVAIPAIILLFDMIVNIFLDLFKYKRRLDDWEDVDSPYSDENVDNNSSIDHQLMTEAELKRPDSPPWEYGQDYPVTRSGYTPTATADPYAAYDNSHTMYPSTSPTIPTQGYSEPQYSNTTNPYAYNEPSQRLSTSYNRNSFANNRIY